MMTCSYCQKPLKAYCGRCGVGVCIEHIGEHRGHKPPEMGAHLRQELEEIVAGVGANLPEPPPTLYDPDPFCGSCLGDGAVPVYSAGSTRYLPCACRYVAR